MQIQITARHLNLTESITGLLTKKINRLERYYDHLVWANAILGVEKHRHFAEIVIHSPLHTLRALAEAGDLYAAIDLVVDKIERQLKKLKEKQKSQRSKANRVGLHDRVLLSAAAAGAGIFHEEGQRQDGRPAPKWPQSISVIKQVPVKPMGVEEAIRMMDSLGYTFWMFLNKSSRKFNVIFKRSDQTYGILEPAPK
ncbi:MAG: ribosome-associated translation inhibitor RaiA [Elusimicrobia bacterium]|nr:ribosome-associated translation inhibitor RaiA [Elusimicrobiota bacterium]